MSALADIERGTNNTCLYYHGNTCLCYDCTHLMSTITHIQCLYLHTSNIYLCVHLMSTIADIRCVYVYSTRMLSPYSTRMLSSYSMRTILMRVFYVHFHAHPIYAVGHIGGMPLRLLPVPPWHARLRRGAQSSHRQKRRAAIGWSEERLSSRAESGHWLERRKAIDWSG